MIIIEAACPNNEDLEEEIQIKVYEFDRNRRANRDCLPLTDYEKMLLAEFMRSLVK